MASTTPLRQDVDDEEDYMNMVFEETAPVKETSLQRRARLKREGEDKGRVKSKKELQVEEDARREKALATALDESNKGFKLMAKLGYKPGTTLGKRGDARMEPIHLAMKDDKGGVGMDSEKKRKFREYWDNEAKKVEVEESNQDHYRKRMREERDEQRLSKLIHGAQKVCERLEEQAQTVENEKPEEHQKEKRTGLVSTAGSKPLKSINVLWRGLVRERLEIEAEKRRKREIYIGLSTKLPKYIDAEEDADDQIAIDTAKDSIEDSIIQEELDEKDPALEEFNALSPGERLTKLLEYLRSTHNYCFWCKYQYPDDQLEGCPGLTEEDHD